MNPPNLPPWGWPWHGRATRATAFSPLQLTLNNGTTRVHPGPVENGHYTYRLKVPGVAPVVRTPEELAADYAQGREWRNEAILVGRPFQLHGRELGGWIYCAPDGTRWIIDLDNAQVRRFGELGRPAQVQALSVAWPSDLGQSTPALGGFVRRWSSAIDVSPDGRRAIFMLYVTDERWSEVIRPVPVGFLLVTVSGNAGGISIATDVLRTREQTLGTPVHAFAITQAQHFLPTSPPTEYWTSNGYAEAGVTGRIVAMWFSPDDGQPVECTVDYLHRYETSVPEAVPEDDTWLISSHTVVSERCVLRLPGAEPIQYDLTDANVQTDRLRTPIIANRTITYTGGGEISSTVEQSGGQGIAFELVDGVAPCPAALDGYGRAMAGDRWRLFSNNLVMFVAAEARSLNPLGNFWLHYLGAMSPQGAVAASAYSDGNTNSHPNGPLQWGAFNPYTGEVAGPQANFVTFI